MAEILPSIFGADLLQLKNEIDFLEKEKTAILHVDLMDGNFVTNIAFGPNQIKVMKNSSNMAFDVHMMAANPKDHLEDVIATGAEMISIHYESTPHVHSIIQRIKKSGRKAGVVLNPSTPESVIKYLLDDIDYVLIMTINPGQPGQAFIPECLEKIKSTKKMIGDRPIQIEVDGGVDSEIAKQCVKAGASMIVVGGYLFSENKKERYDELKKAVRQKQE